MAPIEPTVTVIVPVRNEGAFIADCLDAVLAQDYPHHRLEILVADGMSTDQTRAIVQSFASRHARVRLLDNPRQIVPTGWNLALAQATGQFIVRVDGHCIIAPDYVRRCVEHLQAEDVHAVGGPLDTVGQGATAGVIALAMSSRFGVGGSAFRTVHGAAMLTDTLAFPAYPRWVIDAVGGFDEELVRNQDDEYNFRLRGMGGRVLLAPDIRSRYFSRATPARLWRQYREYGYWKVRVMQKHPRQMRARHFVPPAFVAAILATAALSAIAPAGRIALVTIAALYVVANLAASLSTLRRIDRRLPLLSLAFAILHIGYGIGFLQGLVVFANRWENLNEREANPVLPARPRAC